MIVQWMNSLDKREIVTTQARFFNIEFLQVSFCFLQFTLLQQFWINPSVMWLKIGFLENQCASCDRAGLATKTSVWCEIWKIIWHDFGWRNP